MHTRTNALSLSTAQALSALTQKNQGTLLTAQIHKMGTIRGAAGSKVIYGDDIVKVAVWTGFSYKALIARSQEILNAQIDKGGFIKRLAIATRAQHEGTKIQDACEAIQETRSWFRAVLASSEEDKPQGIWEPLIVNGVRVHGSVVYKGTGRLSDPHAPVQGTIYVSGVKLGERVVERAVNDAWRADSKPKTLAKQIIKDALPIGLYCRYRLDPNRVRDIKVGPEADQAAKDIGINPAAMRLLFRIAP